MTAFTSLLEGLQQVFTLEAMCYLLAGVFIGNVAGLLPGLGATSGTAILLPLTFGMDAVDSLVMLAGIYYGTMYGGTISAILINVPGTTAAAMSSLDGYPLTRRGKGGKALCVATFSCFVGGLIGTLGLTFGGSTLAQVALKFGAPEMFALTLMGLCLVTGITGDYPLKGYLMLIFGLLLGTIGIDTITGQQRFTFNFIYLLDGLNTIPVLVGLFGFSEVFVQLEKRSKWDKKDNHGKVSIRESLLNKEEWKTISVPTLRGTLIGFFVGALPGAGATIASVITYGTEKKLSKHPERFGDGAIVASYVSYNIGKIVSKERDQFGQGSRDAVAACEASNNAVVGGTLIPTLTLGIPGSAATAVLLTAMLMYGVQPGPRLFATGGSLAWVVIASMFVGNILLVLMNLMGIPLFVKILNASANFLMPMVGVLCFIGAYSLNNSVFEVGVMAFFGVLGYILKKLDFPGLPAILGLILGSSAETSLRQGLIMSDNDWSIYFTRPLSLVFMLITFAMLFLPLFRALRNKRKNRAA